MRTARTRAGLTASQTAMYCARTGVARTRMQALPSNQSSPSSVGSPIRAGPALRRTSHKCQRSIVGHGEPDRRDRACRLALGTTTAALAAVPSRGWHAEFGMSRCGGARRPHPRRSLIRGSCLRPSARRRSHWPGSPPAASSHRHHRTLARSVASSGLRTHHLHLRKRP